MFDRLTHFLGERFMPSRWIVGLVLCTVLAVPGGVHADAPPALVIKVKSIDGILQDVKYIAGLAGVGEEIQQVDELLNSFKSDQGLGGIDTTKPWGLYGSLSDDVQNSPLLIMLPIKDEKTFLEFLGNFEIRPEKDKDGIYTIENIPNAPLPVTLYFRFANKYCYLTINEKGNIAKEKLPDPKKALPEDDSVVTISARIAELPDLVKQLLVTNLENMLGELKEKQSDDEPESVTKLKEKLADLLTARVQMLLTDGESLTLRLAMDASKDDMFVEAAFKAKSESALAKEMIAAGKSPTLFAQWANKTDAMNMRLTAMLPDELKKMLGPVVDDFIKSSVKEETDQIKQALMKAGLEKIAPTLKSGKIDAAMSMRGPDSNGHYSLLVGLRVQDGMGIESFVRDVIKNLPPSERDKVKTDVAKVGSANIHQITVDEMEKESKELFGTTNILVGFRDDMAVLGFGPDAMNALKSALQATPSTASMLSLNASVSRAVGLSKADPDSAKMIKIAEDVFGKNPAGTDLITISGEMTDTLRLRIGMKGKLIQFGAKTSEAGIGGGGDK